MTNATETHNICGLKREDFQTTINGKKTDLFILRNKDGNEVAITNYGGAVVAIMVPDKDGVRANVIQGHDNIQDVINSPEPYLSTLIGRYGNRICKGRFQLHGKEYMLPINDGPNSLWRIESDRRLSIQRQQRTSYRLSGNYQQNDGHQSDSPRIFRIGRYCQSYSNGRGY